MINAVILEKGDINTTVNGRNVTIISNKGKFVEFWIILSPDAAREVLKDLTELVPKLEEKKE